MGLFDFMRRRPLREPAALGVFIDEQSALLAQKLVQDYLRLRAGTSAQALFAETTFRAALEKARWEAYPLALAMVGEMVEAELRPHAGGNQEAIVAAVERLILGLFDRKPVPEQPGETAWTAARQEIARSLSALAGQPPKSPEQISDSYAGLFLALMPIHAKLGSDDFPALRNDLAAALGEVRRKFETRASRAVLTRQLAAIDR